MDIDEDYGDDMDTANETDNDKAEKSMIDLIAKVHEEIQPIVSILNDARKRDDAEAHDRQLDYAVTTFIEKYPEVTEKNYKQWDGKIRNARCFYLILQQLNIRTSRNVSMNPLTLFFILLKNRFIYFIHYNNNNRTHYGSYQRR